MEKYISEIANPSPKATVNSYRSFGYNLSTAIADIIDNSISAGANIINLEFEWKGSNSFILIMDNGSGMDAKELVIAMTPGSKDPEEARDEKDLGRFGMGLKTASFSQCKKLTVVSKKSGFNIVKRCWDLDFLNNKNSWVLLDYISDEGILDRLSAYEAGTIVLWEHLDRLVGDSQEDNQYVENAFLRELATVRDHLALVFHKFIESKRVKIIFNGILIESINPFLLNLSVKPEMGISEEFDNAEIRYYILPHMSKLEKYEYENTGGALGWFENQGFYIYRADRLLVFGDWLGLQKKRDYSKLARIEVNFKNSGDFNWNLDIKKSTAIPPLSIRKELKRVSQIAIQKSANIYNWRGKKVFDSEFQLKTEHLWGDEINRDGIKKYKLNRNHPILKQILSRKDSLLNNFIKLIEQNVPVELILTNQNDDPSFHELEKLNNIPSDELLNLAVEVFNIQVQQGVPINLAKEQIMTSVPFNQFPIIYDYLV